MIFKKISGIIHLRTFLILTFSQIVLFNPSTLSCFLFTIKQYVPHQIKFLNFLISSFKKQTFTLHENKNNVFASGFHLNYKIKSQEPNQLDTVKF